MGNLRRKQKLEKRKLKRSKNIAYRCSQDFSKVFSYDNLYNASRDCLKGTGWKASSIAFRHNLLEESAKLRMELMEGSYVQKGFCSFVITERGKIRYIDSMHIRDRAVQKCLCKNYLIPLLIPSLIQDTYACIKGRGIHAFEKRLREFETALYRKTGSNQFYILKMDISSYFDSVDHAVLKDMLTPYVTEGRMREFVFSTIDTFNKRERRVHGKGICLGSEVAQILGQFYLSKADHFAKEKLRLKYYARYNDDIIIYSESKEELKDVILLMKDFLYKHLKLNVNDKKCKIIKCSHDYIVLKTRRRVLPSGKILQLPSKGTRRRKLNDIKTKRRYKRMNNEYIEQSINSWRSSMESRHIKCFTITKALCKEIQKQQE